MEGLIKEIGKMENKTVMVFILELIILKEKDIGKMEKELNG
jgi:hypothetical protein